MPIYAMPLLAYCALVLLSRMAFKHRECVRLAAVGPREAVRLSGGRLHGALLCLLPLLAIQVAPLIEYWLKLQFSPPPDDNAGFFALLDPASAAAGLVIFPAGTALAAVSARRLAAGWQANPGRLFTGGPYRLLRHPMYAGYLLQGVGCALMLSGRWSWLPLAVAAGLIAARCLVEDRELSARFPEFSDYRRTTWRMLPGVF